MPKFPVILASLGAMLFGLISCAGDDPLEIHASPTEVRGHWVRAAQPSFTTIGRDTAYSLVRAHDRDLLVIEEPLVTPAGDEVFGRITWLVPLVPNPRFDTPLDVGQPGGAAWALEEQAGMQAHAVPAKGRIVIHHIDAEQLSATVQLEAPSARQTAGVVNPQKATFDRRVNFTRFTPTTAPFKEITTRRGIEGKSGG